jgi:hypothetical protein
MRRLLQISGIVFVGGLIVSLVNLKPQVVVNLENVGVEGFLDIYSGLPQSVEIIELQITCQDIPKVVGKPSIAPEEISDLGEVRFVVTEVVELTTGASGEVLERFRACIKDANKINVERMFLMPKKIPNSDLEIIRGLPGVKRVSRKWIEYRVWRNSFLYW